MVSDGTPPSANILSPEVPASLDQWIDRAGWHRSRVHPTAGTPMEKPLDREIGQPHQMSCRHPGLDVGPTLLVALGEDLGNVVDAGN